MRLFAWTSLKPLQQKGIQHERVYDVYIPAYIKRSIMYTNCTHKKFLTNHSCIHHACPFGNFFCIQNMYIKKCMCTFCMHSHILRDFRYAYTNNVYVQAWIHNWYKCTADPVYDVYIMCTSSPCLYKPKFGTDVAEDLQSADFHTFPGFPRILKNVVNDQVPRKAWKL